MKKIFSFLLFVTIATAFISCGDSTTDPIEEDKGSIKIVSVPAGASISIDGTATGHVTPFTYGDKKLGEYSVTLSLEGYKDTTVTGIMVTKNETTEVNIELTPEYVVYGPITLWESADPSTNHPSGLSLKLGKAFSIAQSKDSSAYNDIYYNSDGFLVVSADNRGNNTKMTRETFFKEGASTVLTDGEDSPEKAGTWTKSIKDDVRNYIYLYDADGHYSKLIITQKNSPSGTLAKDGNIKVKWIYNKVANSTKF